MNNFEQTLDTFNKEITKLTLNRDNFIRHCNQQLIEQICKGTWIIQIEKNMYYKVIGDGLDNQILYVRRNGVDSILTIKKFKTEFRIATSSEVEQHLEYLAFKKVFKGDRELVKYKDMAHTSFKAFDPMKCDFYMVTCKGIHGAKVRHTTYERAEAEAIRISKKEEHEAWVVGVVASVKPIVKTEVVKTISHKITKR